MSTAVAYPTRTRHYTFTITENLLNLDCSADLRSYRRNLGPGAQANYFEKTSDTIRAQLDDHRAYLLRHRQNGHASELPSPVPRLEVPQLHTAPSSNTVSPHTTASSDNYHTASHPRPMQILSQPHAPQQLSQPSRTRIMKSGDLETYPLSLQQALERCSHYGHQHRPDYVWEVIADIKSNHTRARREVDSRYSSLQDANLQVAELFLFDGYYNPHFEPTYEIRSDGTLMIACDLDGTLGRHVEIYIRSAPKERQPGANRG